MKAVSRTRMAGIGLGIALTLGGCTESVSGTPQPETEVKNLLDARLQLEQSIRFGASIITCMMLDEASGVRRDASNALTNEAFINGPDGKSGTPDDGSQHVALRAQIYNDLDGLTLGMSVLGDDQSMALSGRIDQAAQRSWGEHGMTPDVLQQALKNIKLNGAVARQYPESVFVGISLGREGQTPLLHGIKEDSGHEGVPATLALASKYGAVVQEVATASLKESGIQECNVG